MFNHRAPVRAWTVSFELTYAYANSGTYLVEANVTWGDGLVLASNHVTISVTGAPSAWASLEWWFYGIFGGALVTLAVLVWARRFLRPPPPSLPPSKF